MLLLFLLLACPKVLFAALLISGDCTPSWPCEAVVKEVVPPLAICRMNGLPVELEAAWAGVFPYHTPATAMPPKIVAIVTSESTMLNTEREVKRINKSLFRKFDVPYLKYGKRHHLWPGKPKSSLSVFNH